MDVDPQTNATFWAMGPEAWQEHANEHGTIADLLGAKTSSAEEATKTAAGIRVEEVFPNVDLLPSHIDLFTVDLDLAGATARERKIEKALKEIRAEYDLIVFDCPPNLTIPTQNALAACTHYVIPVSLDFLSGLGIALLIDRVGGFSEDLEHDIELAGIVISRVGRPSDHRSATRAAIEQQFEDKVLAQVLTERDAVSRAASRVESVFQGQNRDAIREFERVSEELLTRLGLPHEDA